MLKNGPVSYDEAMAFYNYLRTGAGELVISGRGVDGYVPTYTGEQADRSLRAILYRLSQQPNTTAEQPARAQEQR